MSLLSPFRAATSAPATPATPATPAGAAPAVALTDRGAELTACGGQPVLQVLRGLDSGLRGLTEAEAAARLERDGENEIARRPDGFPAHAFAVAFRAPFLLVLTVLDVVLALSGDVGGVLAITAMIVIAAVMRFWPERRSRRTVDALRALVLTTATVVRRADDDSAPMARELPFDQLVVGDVVRLAAGDLIPADLRLLRSKDLFLDQSLLSGEAMPVGKHAELSGLGTDSGSSDAHPSEHSALCLAGTHVLSGTATAVVIATGGGTYLAGLGRELDGGRPATAFDRGVSSVSWMLLRFMAVLAPLVFVVSGLASGSWHRAFLFAVAVAVGITPEMLPVVVTTTLARGALAMARRRVIVKRLPAIQDLGAMDVLCVDKTGTLTEGLPTLDQYTDAWGRRDETVLDYAALNSLLQAGWRNPLDEAVVAHAEALGLGPDPDPEPGSEPGSGSEPAGLQWQKVDEIPFDFTRRRMSVVVAAPGGFEPDHVIITKGSVEEVLECCTSVLDEGRIVPLDADIRAGIDQVATADRDAGLRLLAVASRTVPAFAFGGTARPYGVADESGLTLLGLLGFTDPAKDSAGTALAELAARGVAVKVITGDDAPAAARVCREVGLDPGAVADGRTVSGLDDDELTGLAARTTVFAKTDPLAKARIVQALRRGGHTVGYLGDGVNDAPALHAADVGLTAPDATDLARERADVILLDKDLRVLAAGVEEGRRTFANSLKYIRAATSSNFGNVLSVTIAAAFLPFLPMVPIQLLVQNLLYDLSQLSLPWDAVDAEELAEPRRWDSRGLRRFILRLGPLSSLFDLATWAVLWWVLAAGDSRVPLFQTGWFVEGLLSQVLAVHIIRTRRIPFLCSRASRPVLLATGAAMAVGLLLPFSMLAADMGMTSLPALYFGFLALILLGYCALLQIVKD
ncbi:magnesium-translocating P-type ATPase [Catenulispora sp. NF23]|uniref:magnesium-translocating P-type ATPase n=1 Tax=Catenulispora pinistramenti TaxID=2705254 RepID=UPI001BAD5612|nr:magnesium-translocating P-type ATPase [Catenulispora pinistramenti]MBS2539509.1 magnesium-translocating P-type ATPase [Catenulispora pinistramenti]